MLCSVSLLDGAMENVALAKHAKGRCLLEEVCRRLKLTAEIDYFGLKFRNKTGQESWLNLRNEIRKQMSKSNLYRLNLRVKYFANLSEILQENTRHQLFLNVRHNYLQGKYILSRDRLPRFHALLLRSEHGEDALTAVTNYPIILEDWNASQEGGAIDGLRAEHARLKGVSEGEAEKILLSEMEILEPTYGAETFHAINGHQDHVIISVCRDAVRVYGNDKTLIDEYDYESGVYPSTKGTHFFIEIQEDYLCYKISYKLNSVMAARNLHRATVEFCTFFTHDTVSDWVRDSKQRSSSIKTMTSLLKHHIFDTKYTRQRMYKYDIMKTAPEVFEHAWKFVADEKARSIQIRNGRRTPRIPRDVSQVFKFGPDTPRTPKLDNPAFTYEPEEQRTQYKKALKCGQLTPGIARLDRRIFKCEPSTPRSPRPDKQVFQFGPSTPNTSTLDKPVFQFGPSPRTPKLNKQVFQYEPGTPRTPKPDKQAFQFDVGTPRTPNPDKQASKPAVPSSAIADCLESTQCSRLASRRNVSGASTSLQIPVIHVEPPENVTDTSLIANSLRMTPLAKKQKQIFKERFLCKVCKKEYKTCAFVPCGHVVTCWGCALTCDTCQDCNANIESVKPVKYP